LLWLTSSRVVQENGQIRFGEFPDIYDGTPLDQRYRREGLPAKGKRVFITSGDNKEQHSIPVLLDV